MISPRIISLSIVILSCGLFAQDISVAKMVAVNDIQAMTRRRNDINGNACALIKVQFPSSKCSFEGNIVGDISYKTNEYWIYMVDNSKELTIKFPDGKKSTLVKFQDYGISSIESKITYELTIYEERKDAPAIFNEGLIALSEKNFVKAYYCFQQAANNNYPQAYVELGKMYVDYNSDDIFILRKKDYEEAYSFFKKGVLAGSNEAKYLLGRLLLEWQNLRNTGDMSSPLSSLQLKSESERKSEYAWSLIKEAATAGIEAAQWCMILDNQWYDDAAAKGCSIAVLLQYFNLIGPPAPFETVIRKELKSHIPDFVLSKWYGYDFDRKYNYAELRHLIEKVAEEGVFFAKYLLYKNGSLDEKMYLLQEAAKHNNYDMQSELVSHSVPEDKVSLLKNMLEQNLLSRSQKRDVYVELGSIYFERGMYKEALYWLSMGVDLGLKSPKAHYLLGKIYYEGLGTKIDYSKSISYFKEAINDDDDLGTIDLVYGINLINTWVAKSKVALGVILRDGKGVPVDIKQSLKYFLSASSGSSEKIETQMAKCAIGTYCFDKRDFDKANSFFRHSLNEFDLMVKSAEWFDIIDSLTFAKAYYANGMINWHNESSVSTRQFSMDFYFKQSAELGYADAINIIKTGLVTPINSIPILFGATNNNLHMVNSSYFKGASSSVQKAGENQGQSVVKGSEYSIVTTPDIQPSFKGGEGELMAYLAANLKYPIISQENGEQGRVIVSAIVNVDGSLSDVKIERSVSPSLDKEAKRLVSNMPVWNPGMVNNEPVITKCLIPVSFRLTN